MAEPTPNQQIAPAARAGKQVFISYSHTPEENAAFVRNLAGRLTTAGFSVWLDEEQIAGGDYGEQILTAARQSEAAVFVVTERWTRRPWTRHELKLFGDRSNAGEDVRLVVLGREKVDYGALGPYLSPLLRIDWQPDDDDADARFWQIFCGIERETPGPRRDWAAKGRAIAEWGAQPDRARKEAPRVRPARTTERTASLSIAGEGQPVELVSSGADLFVVTDRGEWIGMTETGLLAPLPRLANALAWIEDTAGKLVVGTCDSMLACLQRDCWDYWRLAAPALSLCNVADRLYAGTVSGAVMHIANAKAEIFCRQREAVVALAAAGEDVLYTLGAQGQLGRVALDGSRTGETRWADATDLGRPFGFFPAVDIQRVGLFSATRLGFVEAATDRVRVAPLQIEDGVREVLFLGAGRWPFAIMTDAGKMFLASAELDRLQPAPLPPQAWVMGCCRAAGSALAAAWTREGRLYVIEKIDAAPRCAVEGGVMMAAPLHGARALAVLTTGAAGDLSMRMVPP